MQCEGYQLGTSVRLEMGNFHDGVLSSWCKRGTSLHKYILVVGVYQMAGLPELHDDISPEQVSCRYIILWH